MKILVTGATGLIGAHTAVALLEGGHDLRLLVRNEDAARRYFTGRGFDLGDVVVADIRDEAKVQAAVAGCDAVLHSAALVSLDRRRAAEILANNLGGTRTVIGAACAAGIRRIVYVSSLSAFALAGAPRIDESSPLGQPREAYSKSKRDAEEYVRGLQAQNQPITITYPAGVLGPLDPKLSEANHALVTMLTTMVPRTSTGMQCVDVRDIAAAHRYLLENPPAGDFAGARYVLGGHYYPWDEVHRMLESVTARRIPGPKLPGAMLRLMGSALDLLQGVVPFATQMTGDAMAIATQWTPADSTRFVARSGLAFRAGEETFAETIRWLASAGHLPAKHAGKLRAA